ncbi:hypothetical protein K431DRAFT_318291 [Polychaeton citri CBS 116435]|uniref:Autophagy-related protein 11 n=1 Tax=Polychaeton citri CBS 116435 TaxID=1314669 RepID=A0A9P4UTB0_9PEZI|nr:hypothetical protein K431DRAFT_318291 [Polychaeton citri CBS 116435]
MSIIVYVGHSGQRLTVDPGVTSTLDALRSRIAQDAGIQPRSQILLTAQGRQVRTQTLLTENELFAFDSALLTTREPVEGLHVSPGSSGDESYDPGVAPDTIADQNDLRSWQNLFKQRKDWASGLFTACSDLAQRAQQLQDEEIAINRSLNVAVVSLQQHVKSAQQKYDSAVQWSGEIIREHEAEVANWEDHLDSLRHIPARSEFVRFIQAKKDGSTRRLSQVVGMNTLQGFVDLPAVRKSAGQAKSILSDFTQQINNITQNVDHVAQDSQDLQQAAENMGDQSVSESSLEPQALLEEITAVFKKVASDLEHVQSLSSTSTSVSQASKMALLHTRNYLPNLSEYCTEMNELISRCRDKRNSAADMGLEHMRTLSNIESQIAFVYSDLKGLEFPEESEKVFTTLSIISRLPSVYGQLLVESVRRREWVAKMKRDSANLQEEMAVYQEEEEKRRKKWMQSVEDIVDPESLLSTKALGIEMSLQNEGGSWPAVTRQELDDYLSVLLQVYGSGPVTDEFEQSVKDLDKPTRKQIKHAKAFKNGSMHEAAFGDTSLLLRGDDQHKTLRESNSRLQEELKAQKSRQIEEKKLARRVVDLEAELSVAKDHIGSLENEAKSRKDSDAETQKQVDEAISTKKDLMENMEAQQREFANERRTLELELQAAKEKIEEAEDEIERMAGSRDHERAGTDERVKLLEEEVARLKEDAAGHAARAATAQDARTIVERKLERAERARNEADLNAKQLQDRLNSNDLVATEQSERFASAFAHLSPKVEAPNGLAALSIALEEVARKSVAHAKDMEEAVAFAKSENESLWRSNESQRGELSSSAERYAQLEDELQKAQEQKAGDEAKVTTLEQQLQDEQAQLRSLRDKFADGETGSEVLRQRVAEEEQRASNLAKDLAEAKSHVNSIDVELMRMQKKHKTYQESADSMRERLGKRAERAKEVSQRLYAQNARLSRLLERIGLAISYGDNGTMVIERASKLGASSIVDPHSLLNRTISITSPPVTRRSSGASEPTDLMSLHWPDAISTTEEGNQYEAFLLQMSRFNIETFSDAVVKRIRDFEYTAKKYIREAKETGKRAEAYKERSIKLRGEAHAKIAVKDFKEGDLALFLPTRGQAKGAWAAFNIGCPHYFLAEKEGMRLVSREFIVARISKVEQKVVDLSKTLSRDTDDHSEAPSLDDDNPFDLSDGLTWWLVHAAEDRGIGGAPTTPGLGKSTVAAVNVDAKGSIRMKRASKSDDASKHLNKSLESRRSSSNSKRSVAGSLGSATAATAHATASGSPVVRSRAESQASLRPPPGASGNGLGIIQDNHDDAQYQGDQVRRDLLWGP